MQEVDQEKSVPCERMNIAALAFVGDAVYELFVREHLVNEGWLHADKLHREAIKYVRAESQAKAVRALKKNFLTEDEIKLVRYARNHKTPNRSRSAGPIDYKLATAFEALLGKLEKDGRIQRAEEIMQAAIKAIDEGE
jgi:ribonuclease-3 family protein